MDTSENPIADLADDLLALTARLSGQTAEDPFGKPVLLVALAITRRIDSGALKLDEIEGMIRLLRDAAFADRAQRMAAYVGLVDLAASEAALEGLARQILRPDPNDSPVRWADYRAMVERTRFAAVFTAHPTFALPYPVAHSLAETASGRPGPGFASHRPGPMTLREEFTQANAAIANGRAALDRFNAALLSVARDTWPDRWTELVPRPVILASWVGYDTDGRTDIGWWDTLLMRLEMKRLQLVRLGGQVADLPAAGAISARIAEAVDAVTAQIDACPAAPDPVIVARFAHILLGCASLPGRPITPVRCRWRSCCGAWGATASPTSRRCRTGWRWRIPMFGSMRRNCTTWCASASASPIRRKNRRGGGRCSRRSMRRWIVLYPSRWISAVCCPNRRRPRG